MPVVNLALLVLGLASYSAMGSGPTSNEHRVYVKYVIARYTLLVATRTGPCFVSILSPRASRAMCKPLGSVLRHA